MPKLKNGACSFLIAVFVTAAGCSGPEKPEEVYARYLQHLVNGEVEAAFELLTPESKRALAEMGEAKKVDGERSGLEFFRKALASTGGAGVPLIPEDSPQRIQSLKRLDSDVAILEIATPSGPRHPRLERRDGHWLVALKLPDRPR